MYTYVCDLEANGLLVDATKIHCIVLMNTETEEIRVFDDIDLKIKSAISFFNREDVTVVFHNAMGYDIPLIEKLYPDMPINCKVLDTLIFSRLTQMTRARHSIDSYGEEFGIPKPKHEDWSVYSEEMKHRCIEDVKIGKRVFDKVYDPSIPYELEHEVQYILSKQELNGWFFDYKKADQLQQNLLLKKQELYDTVIKHTTKVVIRGNEFIPKRDDARRGYKAGCKMTKIKLVDFNPSSRSHIIYLLKTKYNHTFTKFTKKENIVIDEKVIEELPYEELRPLKEYFQVKKALGFIAEGDNAWLKLINNGRLHHYCNCLGTVTGRASHNKPNLGQVPSDKKYLGKECRELFIAPKGKILVGCDLSGAQLRCLGHYLSEFDGGAYAREVVEGDVHTANQEAAELPTRDSAKTFIYAFLFGAGNAKIGSIIGKGRAAGGAIKAKFFNKIPAVKQLIDKVQKASERGFLYGINKRKIHINSTHSALNYLLQSLEAYIAKQWLVLFYREMRDSYPEIEYKQLAWVHDEINVECDEEDADVIGNVLVKTAREAGLHWNLKVPIDAEYKKGYSWYEIH